LRMLVLILSPLVLLKRELCFGSIRTKKARTVLNQSITAMLSARRDRLKPVSDDKLVFKIPEGLLIDDHNFCRRAWKMVLIDVGVKYRKPYTLILKNGASYIQVAAAADHNPQSMQKHCSDVIQEWIVFVPFEY
jgi:hypothetical protein